MRGHSRRSAAQLAHCSQEYSCAVSDATMSCRPTRWVLRWQTVQNGDESFGAFDDVTFGNASVAVAAALFTSSDSLIMPHPLSPIRSLSYPTRLQSLSWQLGSPHPSPQTAGRWLVVAVIGPLALGTARSSHGRLPQIPVSLFFTLQCSSSSFLFSLRLQFHRALVLNIAANLRQPRSLTTKLLAPFVLCELHPTQTIDVPFPCVSCLED